MVKEITSPDYKVLVEKLEREIRLNHEMIDKVQEELKENKKKKEKVSIDEELKNKVMLQRQIQIAQGYIEYHREMIGVIKRADTEREGE